MAAEELPAAEAVRSYKGLRRFERAFRSYKTVDLKVRPVAPRLKGRVRAHVLLCRLADYVEWPLRRTLAPRLFDDHDPEAAEAARSSRVPPARSTPAARAKAGRKRTLDSLPVHSFQTLLADLAPLIRNRVQPRVEGAVAAPMSLPALLRSKLKLSAFSTFAYDPYPVAYTPQSRLCHSITARYPLLSGRKIRFKAGLLRLHSGLRDYPNPVLSSPRLSSPSNASRMRGRRFPGLDSAPLKPR